MATKNEEPKDQAPNLSHKDALTASFGNDRTLEAQKVGYDGYVWEEDKAQYSQLEVTKNDQSGPLKTVEEDHDFMNDHFIRADKLDNKKK